MSILQRSGADFAHNHYDNIMQVLDIISKFSDHQAYNLSQELQGNKVGLLWWLNCISITYIQIDVGFKRRFCLLWKCALLCEPQLILNQSVNHKYDRMSYWRSVGFRSTNRVTECEWCKLLNWHASHHILPIKKRAEYYPVDAFSRTWRCSIVICFFRRPRKNHFPYLT